MTSINKKKPTRRDLLKGAAAVLALGALSPAGLVPGAEEEPRKYHNPIFPGANADPEVLLSRKTGRAYVYPTSSARGFCA